MDSIKYKPISDVGLVRTNNEDSFIAELLWDKKHLLCAAIDGVGGYEGGEVAAEIARSTIIGFLHEYPDSNLKDVIAQAVLQANNNIYEQRKKDSRFPNMSCVASAAIIDTEEEKVYIAHVGDSRIYLYDRGKLTKLTHDHSLVGYREELGELTEIEAMNHPRRNIIERSLGEKKRVFGEGNFIDSAVFDIPANGKLLFCSDGLTDLVTSAEIIDILSRETSTSDKCTELVECAKKHGGKDNITVVLVETETKTVTKDEVKVELPKEPLKGTVIVEESKEDKKKDKPSLISRLWKPVLLLLLGVAFGFACGYCLNGHQKVVPPAELSWEEVLRWSEKQAPVDTSLYGFVGDKDSVLISRSSYYQLKFYDDHINSIIELKRNAEKENDSLHVLLAVKDSLLRQYLETPTADN